MPTPPDSNRYHGASIALHWLMLLLLVAVYAAINLRELYPRGTDIREAFKTWHFMLGLSVLTLVLLRIGMRLLYPAPPITPRPGLWQLRAGRAAHLALYVLMIGMPIGGWLILSASGKPIPFFGLDVPPLIGPDKAFAATIKDLHETVGELGYWLIGFHALAALFHHYWLKDDTLRRMLPGRR